MSAKKNWSLVLQLTEQAPGERHVAEAHVRFKRIARRYTRRAMKHQLDELLVELVVDRLAEKRELEKELAELRQLEAEWADLEWYDDQRYGSSYDDGYYDDYHHEVDHDDRLWREDFAMHDRERYMDAHDESWDEHPLTVELFEYSLAERQKDEWLNGGNPSRWRR